MCGKDARETGTKGNVLIPCQKNRILVADNEKLVLKTFEHILAYSMPTITTDFASDGRDVYSMIERRGLDGPVGGINSG